MMMQPPRWKPARALWSLVAWRCGPGLFLLTVLLVAIAMRAGADQVAAATNGCDPTGSWLAPGSPEPLDPSALWPRLASRQVVLLGESHTNPEDHGWQLQTLAALYAFNPDMVIGFESFPRKVQGLLDRWVSGELPEQAFLEAVDWQRIWGYDAELYLPLFRFARRNHIPMVALNVERALVSRVAEEGWHAVPVAQREGVGEPEPAGEGYRRRLAEVMIQKRRLGLESGGEEQHESDDSDSLDIDAMLAEPGFQRFVEAQLTWDRAMAEALAGALQHDGVRLVVAVLGRGHVAYKDGGVARQLQALGVGVDAVATLLPVDALEACEPLPDGMADAVFVVPGWTPEESHRLLLGVSIEAAKQGVRVIAVSTDSVAEAAGVRVDDIMVRAAGRTLQEPGDLIGIIAVQAPGTWLPLVILRGDEEVELVARFDPEPDSE